MEMLLTIPTSRMTTESGFSAGTALITVETQDCNPIPILGATHR
jgi:hypothetical protein